jgi:pyridoxal phosphate enzyme (YggS family)
MQSRINKINQRIHQTAINCGRLPESVQLVAVSKTKPVDMVREALEAGIAVLGESYIQEAREKVDSLSGYPAAWHFIGHLQTNKSKYAVRLFNLIHSVDTIKLAGELDKEAGKINKIQDILIQVNLGREPTKSGVSTDETINMAKEISTFSNLSVKGLMTMPPYFKNQEQARPFFVMLRDLRDRIREENIPNISMDQLSMGMTHDFEVAIQEGATLVRIGTAIFGKRK